MESPTVEEGLWHVPAKAVRKQHALSPSKISTTPSGFPNLKSALSEVSDLDNNAPTRYKLEWEKARNPDL